MCFYRYGLLRISLSGLPSTENFCSVRMKYDKCQSTPWYSISCAEALCCGPPRPPFLNDRYKNGLRPHVIYFFFNRRIWFQHFIIRITSAHISWWKQRFFFFFEEMAVFPLIPAADQRGLRRSLSAKTAQDAAWSLFKMCANDAH